MQDLMTLETLPSTAHCAASSAADILTSEIVPSDEGPPRKYYGLNKAGRDMLDSATKTWGHFSLVMTDLLSEEAAA